MRFKLTPEILENIIKLNQQGSTPQEISKIIGCSPDLIRLLKKNNFDRYTKIRKPRDKETIVTPDLLNKMKELTNNGFSKKEICKQLNIRAQLYANYKLRMFQPYPPGKPKPPKYILNEEQKESVIQLHKETGLAHDMIAKRLNLRPAAVHNTFKEFNLNTFSRELNRFDPSEDMLNTAKKMFEADAYLSEIQDFLKIDARKLDIILNILNLNVKERFITKREKCKFCLTALSADVLKGRCCMKCKNIFTRIRYFYKISSDPEEKKKLFNININKSYNDAIEMLKIIDERIKEKLRVCNEKFINEKKPRKEINKSISGILIKSAKYNAYKEYEQFFEVLGFTFEQFKFKMESYFKMEGNEWMNWNNWGRYDPKSWKNDDSSTWVWNLDHIIPKSLYHFSDMKDYRFKLCWKLSNLRPLIANKNTHDGATKIRHKQYEATQNKIKNKYHKNKLHLENSIK